MTTIIHYGEIVRFTDEELISFAGVNTWGDAYDLVSELFDHVMPF